MSAPERPPPPIPGKLTHHSIELNWEEAVKKAMTNYTRADGRIKVTLQEEDKHANWVNVYCGYAKRHIVDNLEPWTQYKYRLRFSNNQGNSEWSNFVQVFTLKEPMNGEHLHKAVLMQNLQALEAVVQSGDVSTVDTVDRLGFTPLMQAAQKGYHEFIDILAHYGAEIDFQNDTGKTAMMMAAFAGKLMCVKELRHFGADYDKKDRGGSTAFHWAMDSKSTEMIDWMIDDGANMEVTDLNGWTPLLRVAAVGGSADVTRLLLRRGANFNCRDNNGKTPLMISVINGHTSMVEQLLKKGVDVLVKNEFGKSAYEMALSMDRRKVIKLLEDHFQEHNIKPHKPSKSDLQKMKNELEAEPKK